MNKAKNLASILLLLIATIGSSYNASAIYLKFTTDVVTANNDFGVVNLNQPEVINVLDNDYGLIEGIKSLKITSKPQHGTIKINDNNTITYFPDVNYSGKDVFEYEVCNKEGECGKATVQIDVLYIDYKPVAYNDTIQLYWTKEKLIQTSINDSNLLNFPIELNILSSPHEGEAWNTSDTTVMYAPDRGFFGLDSIQYKVCDKEGDCSSAWIIIKLLDAESNEIFIPNGFSPNGDGINDLFFVPDFKNASNVQVTIFTRWGKIIYQNKNYKNDWDGVGNTGIYSGKKLDSGTYFYRFKVPDLNLERSGYVYINH